MPAEYRLLPREDWPLWDAFVRAHQQGSVFQESRWLERVGDSLRVDVLEEKGEILA